MISTKLIVEVMKEVQNFNWARSGDDEAAAELIARKIINKVLADPDVEKGDTVYHNL